MSSRRAARPNIEAILNGSAEPFFVLDGGGRIIFFNRACAELTGCPSDRAIGLRCVFRGASGTDGDADVAAGIAPPPEVLLGQQAVVQTMLLDATGARLLRHVHFFPCRGQSGELLAVLGLISERPGPLAARDAPHIELHEELLRLRQRLYSRFGCDRIVAASHAMRRVLDQVRLAAGASAHVLIWGEPGTGKEFIARTVHRESPRAAAPFVPVDCAISAPDALEQSLFGPPHDGAARRDGVVRGAVGGTLLLKNLRRLPRDLQARLADMLRNAPAGGLTDDGEPLDVRIMATERSDPVGAVAQGELRADLYFALSALAIQVPALRDRRDDIPLLAQQIIESANANGDKQVAGIARAALDVLCAYDWPTNLHGLDEVLRLAHARCGSILIEPADLSARIQGAWGGAYPAPPPPDHHIDLDAVLAKAERKLIELALEKAQGNKSRAAELLSISRPRLYRRMAMLGMEVTETVEPAVASQPAAE